jgi:hypothetical protein
MARQQTPLFPECIDRLRIVSAHPPFENLPCIICICRYSAIAYQISKHTGDKRTSRKTEDEDFGLFRRTEPLRQPFIMAHHDVDRPKPKDMPGDHGAYLRPWSTFKIDALPRILDARIGKDGYIRPFMNHLTGAFCQQHIRHARNYTTDDDFHCTTFSSPAKEKVVQSSE